MNEVLRIVDPGACSTVQDLGRRGQAHLGVPVSGAMDEYAHSIANWLVGNTACQATLEMTISGAAMEVLVPCSIALTGADMGLTINGVAKAQWHSHQVQTGDSIRIGTARTGCRGYLALAGGVASPMVLGSRSTYLGGRFGGHAGRMLKAGDILSCNGVEQAEVQTTRRLPWSPAYADSITLRAIAGPQDNWFSQDSGHFFQSRYTLSPQSDRMGCRLEGSGIKKDADAPENLLSIPIAAGNVQIPPDGQPIVLFREQTIGGYPCIATVLSCDLWRLAQARPGASVCFQRVSLETGQHLARKWQDVLATARCLLATQTRPTRPSKPTAYNAPTSRECSQ